MSEALQALLGAAGTAIVLLLGALAWFVRSSVAGTQRIETKVDHLAALLSESRAQLGKVEVLVNRLEHASEVHELRLDDLEGFLGSGKPGAFVARRFPGGER